MRRSGAEVRLGPVLLAAVVVSAHVGCGRSARSSPGAALTTEAEPDAVDADAPMDRREAQQWDAAAQGDPEELMRIEDLVGCRGLRERAARVELRVTALRAMQYCSDFSEFAWLAQIADQGTDSDAVAALEAIDAIAARPRRATDPEDADEVHAGCGVLLALARAPGRPQQRRLLAIRALRMLTDRGCAAP